MRTGDNQSLSTPPKPSRVSALLQRNYLAKWTVVGVLIGTIAGFGATAFYFLIQLTTNLFLGGITGFYPPNPTGESLALLSNHPTYWLIPVSTALGGLVTGFLVYKFAPEAEGHGTDEAIAAFHRKDGKIRRRIPVVKAIASAFTIGSGGSGGREGPTAQIAAGFGSYVGDALKLAVKDKRIAVAVGIGAGIGSIFKSPFGGAMLSGEILYSGGDFETEALIPGFIASPIGYVIFASFTGFSPIFGNSVSYVFTQPANLVFYAALGVVCGLVGRVWTTSFYATRRAFASLKIPRYLKPAVGLTISGVIGVFFPEVLGLGYGFLQYLIDGRLYLVTANYFAAPILLILLLVILFKILATSFTVGSGGSAGVFAPSLVIGGFVGAAFWVALNYALPGQIPVPAPLVIVGMVALFGGVGRVPIAVILMVSEMTGTLSLLAPSMVAVVLAYVVTGPKFTIYRSQVERRADSPAHRGEYNVPLLTKIFVSDAMNHEVYTLSPSDAVASANQAMVERGFRGIPVVESGQLVGIVTMSDVLRIPQEKMGTATLREVMTQNPLVVHPGDSLLAALEKMTNNGVGRLPVVSEAGRIVGIISRTDVTRAYNRTIDLLSKSEQT
ncbi:MAG: chloride channel protein [Nitrososphaerota archaeon]|nr:chloride channel protein [Nitrososphaerota archaeon]